MKFVSVAAYFAELYQELEDLF